MSEPREGPAPRAISLRLDTSPAAGASWLWPRIRRYRYVVASVVMFCIIAAVAVSFLVTPKYRTTVVATYATPSGLSGSLQTLMSKFGGLASLAGITPTETDNSSAARTMLESRLVAGDLIQQYHLMPLLFRGDWDPDKHQWRPKRGGPPTLQQGIDAFTASVLSVDFDNLDGKVSVSVTWFTPESTAMLANAVIAKVNATLRQQALHDATTSLDFLRRESARTTEVELNNAISTLMQQQMYTIMYANVHEDYALRILDPAAAPDPRDVYWPKKWQLALVGAVFGAALAVALVILLDARRARKKKVAPIS